MDGARRPRLEVSGRWPGQVLFRRPFARASAHPWNDELPWASLRLDRGGAEFLASAAAWLVEAGAREVRSPPLQAGTADVWERAGFRLRERLLLFRRSLSLPIPLPSRPVMETESIGGEIPELDRLSFEPTYRMGRIGLEAMLEATPVATLLTVGEPALGFAVAGLAGRESYLQRLAVVSSARRRGAGTSLLRAALRWARDHGAWTMMLNTPEEGPAASLYQAEGFHRDGAGVDVYAFPAPFPGLVD